MYKIRAWLPDKGREILKQIKNTSFIDIILIRAKCRGKSDVFELYDIK